MRQFLTAWSGNEPVIDDIPDAEEPDADLADVDVNGDEDIPGGTEDPDARRPDNVVVSGDPNALAAAQNRNAVLSQRAKRIENEKRATTPYMTKYERARILGTRALQIRYVHTALLDCYLQVLAYR